MACRWRTQPSPGAPGVPPHKSLPRQQIRPARSSSTPQHSAAASSHTEGCSREHQLPDALSRSAALRAALLSVAGAAFGAALPAGHLPPAAAAEANAALPPTAALLPPLRPLADVAAAGGARTSLVLADPQLLPLPPGPIAFPRRQLDLGFAVLLMRTGYDTVDDLDCIAMNDFQRLFWKLRQAEWQPYTLLYSPLRVQQGQLVDPLYFDFISYSQFAAAAKAMAEGKQVFNEYNENTEGMEVVERDARLANNALLPGLFFERHGERMYRGLVEGFRGVQYGAPLPCSPGAPMEAVLAGVQQLEDIFIEQGYALKATVTPGSSSSSSSSGASGSFSSGNFSSDAAARVPGSEVTTFTVRLEGPANLWSLQALAARRSALYNAHDAAVVGAFLRASGRPATCRLAWSDTAVTQEWTVGTPVA